jgi:predicted MPP superfamily phosphohydrolase
MFSFWGRDLSHTGLTDVLSLKNIIEYIRFSPVEKYLRITKAHQQKHLDKLGVAPVAQFAKKGNWIDEDTSDLEKSITSNYEGNIWHTTIPHVKGPNKSLGDPENLKILHLTDLHIGIYTYDEFLEKHKNILDHEYDIVIGTGDWVHLGSEEFTEEYVEFFKQIRSKNKFAITGNHDGRDITENEIIKDRLNVSGFDVINFEKRILDFNGYKVEVVGFPDRRSFDLMDSLNGNPWQKKVYELLDEKEEDIDFTISAYHRPDDIFSAARVNGDNYIIPGDRQNLILAGHYHDCGIKISAFNHVLFSLKFWLGFHGVANGLNNLYGGIKMPNSDTVINVGPGSVDKLMFRVPGFQTVRTWFPTIYQKIKNYEYFTMLDKFRFPKSIQKFTGREYMPGLNKIAGRVAGPEILTVTNYSN